MPAGKGRKVLMSLASILVVRLSVTWSILRVAPSLLISFARVLIGIVFSFT